MKIEEIDEMVGSKVSQLKAEFKCLTCPMRFSTVGDALLHEVNYIGHVVEEIVPEE